MKRGRLRVLLGAAPGVGKTYEMLEEGRRLRDSGRDVVIGLRRDARSGGDRRTGRGPADRPPSRRRPSRRRAHRDGRRRGAGAASRTRPGRRTGAHQRARVAQSQTLAGRAGAAGCRHRRDHDGERAAHRVAERRRRADHGHRAARDGAGCRRAGRRPDRGRRPRAAVAARPALGRSRLSRGAGRCRAVELLPARQPHGAAGARAAVARRRGRHRPQALSGGARHHGHVARPGARGRGAHRRPGGRDTDPARRPHRGAVGRAARSSPCTCRARTACARRRPGR